MPQAPVDGHHQTVKTITLVNSSSEEFQNYNVLSLKNGVTLTNSADPDEMQHFAAIHLWFSVFAKVCLIIQKSKPLFSEKSNYREFNLKLAPKVIYSPPPPNPPPTNHTYTRNHAICTFMIHGSDKLYYYR